MGVEKGGSKGSGFFHLFDWNRKSRKKLFNISPEGTKQGKRIEETLPSTRLRMIDDDELVGVSSIKGSSDYSCASSITDDDLNGSKAPGVVARLMGLDSMPTSATSEPYCTPFRDTRSFRESYLKRSPEYSTRDPLTNNQHRIENSSYMRRPVDLRAQKMPSSPIERFQMEALPPRSGKPLPMTYHKLLSPIKNPGFTSARNAAQIMEAAAKILEPRLQSVGNGREKVCSFGQGRVAPYSKDSVMASQRASRLLQMSRVPVESSETRFSRGNREEDIIIFRSSPDPYEVSLGSTSGSSNVKGNNSKGKSVSLAVQAKVNVQKREGVNLSSRHSSNVQKEHEDSRPNQTFRSQPSTGNSASNQRTNIKQQKKQGSSNSSVLKQNNQKQNCIVNRNKSGTSKSGSSQQGRKGASCESSSSKHKSLSRLANSSKPRSTIELEKEASFSSNKDFPQKKRLIERDTSNSDKHEQGVQQNVVIDEFSKWNTEAKDTTDVVSFTFTSPLVKQAGNAQYQILGAEKLGLASRSNGDALSLLLEQKLRELTARSEPSTDFGRCINFSSLEQEFSAEGDVGLLEDGRRNGFSKDAGIFNFTKHHTLEVVEKGECSNLMDLNSKEDDQLSPLSVLDEETFITNESYCTSQDSTCSDASKISPSSVQAQHNFSTSKKVFSSDNETKLADSACSSLLDTSKFFDITPVKQPKTKTDPELEYISEILSNTELERKALHGTQLDSPLFDKLERKRGRSKMENDTLLSQGDRKLLFDCVNECLDLRIDYHFKAGYEAWNKGTLAVKKGLHKRVYDEISGWKNMADLNVDDIVEKDMGTGLGTWMDFRVEAFEAGTDLEAEILNSLINEMVCDILKRQR